MCAARWGVQRDAGIALVSFSVHVRVCIVSLSVPFQSSPRRSACSFSPALGSFAGGRRLSDPAVGSVMPRPSR